MVGRKTEGEKARKVAKYQLGSPNGWMGSSFEADTDEDAVLIAEAAPYRESVLDLQEWDDEDGSPITLLVVADE